MSDAATRVHHPYSPSKLQALEACPKFRSRDGESEASRAGTLQHDAVEAASDSPVLKDHQAIAVAECLAYADRIAENYHGGEVLTECYLPIDNEKIVVKDQEGKEVEFEGTTAGYLDRAFISSDRIRGDLIDWKFGQWAVEDTDNNLQGIAYALGLLRVYPKLERITVHFVMPHRDEVDIHTFIFSPAVRRPGDTPENSSVEDVNALFTRVRTVVGRAVEAARDPKDFSTARPANGVCRFCSLIGQCPKVAEFALNVAKKYSFLRLPENLDPTLIERADDTAIGLQIADAVTAWAKSYRQRATELTIVSPDFIPDGYILVQSQKRKMKDAKKFGDLAKAMLPPELAAKVDELYDIPMGGVEDLIELATARGKKSAAKKQFSALAIESGAVEMGAPFAFLKLDTKGKTENP